MSDTATQAQAGRHAFEPAVAALYAEDPHRPGSVDAVLLDSARPLTPHTRTELYQPPAGPPAYARGSRPELEALVAAALEGATHEMPVAVALMRFCAAIPRRFPTPERSTASGFYGDFTTFLCGGTEEDVIKKGSPLAAERARVLCAMAQVAGLPARLVFLAREAPAERHAVTEIFLLGRWTVFDAFSGRFYTWPKHGYVSAWEARRLPHLIDHHPDHGRQRYVDSAYFRHAAVASYNIADHAQFSYPWDSIPPGLAARLRDGQGG